LLRVVLFFVRINKRRRPMTANSKISQLAIVSSGVSSYR